ncbi:hypothetical protein AB0K43_05565 [Kitasatospora sp. NPDC049258]
MGERIPRWGWWALGITAALLYLASNWADGVPEDETGEDALGWYENTP